MAESDNDAPPSARRAWPRLAGLALVGALTLALVAVLAYGLANRTPPTGQSGATRVGKPAPPFAMELYDGGGRVRFSPDSGMPVVLNFWASWCPPCREESPLLERTWRQYEGRGVLFVGVDTQDTEVDARAYIEEFGLSFPNGLDADGEITVAYGVVGLPVTFFIGSDGVVKRRWVGALTESQLLPWVEELAAAAP